MGVPALFRWLSKKYPKIIQNVEEEEPRRVTGADGETIEIPLDMSRPNPNGEEFDCLYLDMNGIVHPCTHPEGKPAPETEEDMMVEVFRYTERVVNMVRPRKLLMMAIDGVAPRAKMNQQRSRRFRAAQDAKIHHDELERELEERKRRGNASQDETVKRAWDSNAITPGTPFMDLLASSLRYWIAHKMNTDEGWRNLTVVLSDASVPGEGEHKIMDYIRRKRSDPNHDPNMRHVIYGLDADLIMLSLATHEPYFKVLREDVFAQDKDRGCRRCGQDGHFAANCTAPETAVAEKKPSKKPFIFLDVPTLREYLAIELHVANTPFPFDLERAIDDWVFLIFFVGNDFLPHLPSLEIREGAIDTLLGIWKKELPRMSGYVTNNGKVELANAQIIMDGLTAAEADIFRRRHEQEEREANRKRARQRDQERRQRDEDRWQEEERVPPPVRRGPPPGAPPVPPQTTKREGKVMLLDGDSAATVSNRANIRMANISAAESLRAELLAKKTKKRASTDSTMFKLDEEIQDDKTHAGQVAAGVKRALGDVEFDSDTRRAGEKATAEEEDEGSLKKRIKAESLEALVKSESATKTSAKESTTDAPVKEEDTKAPVEEDELTKKRKKAEALEALVRDDDDENVIKFTRTEAPESSVKEEDDAEDDQDEDEEDDDAPEDIPALKVNADGTVDYEDTVKLWEPGYRERYYRQKFGVELSDAKFRRQVVKSYVEGLCWVLAYYYQGCPSWHWYYPYHYSPFAADFTELASLDIRFELGSPFRPFEQLMGVLPAASRTNLPPPFQWLMTAEESEIIDFYPTTFEIDMNGKKMAWQGVALLPFIDEKRLLEALNKRYPELTDDENRRNSFGRNVVFAGPDASLIGPLGKLYAKRALDAPQEIDTAKERSVAGLIEADPSCIPGSTFYSPLPNHPELGDISGDRSVYAFFDFPPQRKPHRSVILSGLKVPTRRLNAADADFVRRGGRGGPPRGRQGAGPGGWYGQRGSSSSQGPYGGGQYNQGPYGGGQYSQGPYGAAQPNQGPYGAGPYGAPAYAAGPYGAPAAYGAGPYNAPAYAAGGPYGAAPYGGAQSGGGPYANAYGGAGPYGAQNYGAGPYGAQNYAAGPYGTQNYAAGPYGAAPYGGAQGGGGPYANPYGGAGPYGAPAGPYGGQGNAYGGQGSAYGGQGSAYGGQQQVFQLIPGVQSYDWGKRGAAPDCLVAKFASATEQLHFTRENDSPYAELWMGAHPTLPSRVASDGTLLSDRLVADPTLLGEQTVAAYGVSASSALPFLFKVLSIDKALSIQAHPDKRLAEQLHASKPDMYKDPNHKPEMAVAIADFEGFCGFRPLPEILHFIKVVPEWRELLGADAALEDELANARSEDDVRAVLRRVFSTLMRTPENVYQDVVGRLSRRYAAPGPHEVDDEVAALVVRLNSQFPLDIGVLCTFVLNIVHLQPGDAMFLCANEPHAYLSGNILECMAASDNVVRAGLTPKARDVDVLVDMLTYRSGDADSQRLRAERWTGGADTVLYNPPIDEFAVLLTRIGGGKGSEQRAIHGPSILLVVEGTGSLTADGQKLPLAPGLVYFVGAETPVVYEASEPLTISRAFIEP
ncbi:5'-3' exoribonuclease 2 [Malassezia cuniculi]|uniref:Mannose-6-phosphate isomerase n=1 Tax=Malassezia cuniculi TaxID=948313 RepID=A0AAF0EVH8_9BASI|nr:5'-3' exoribonuclease 2 [Malassezia cuniculi]